MFAKDSLNFAWFSRNCSRKQQECFAEPMVFSKSSVYKTILSAVSLHTTHHFQ